MNFGVLIQPGEFIGDPTVAGFVNADCELGVTLMLDCAMTKALGQAFCVLLVVVNKAGNGADRQKTLAKAILGYSAQVSAWRQIRNGNSRVGGRLDGASLVVFG